MPTEPTDSLAVVRKIRPGPNTKVGRLIAAASLRAQGFPPPEIAEKLGLSVVTVKAYLREAVRSMNSPELEDWRQLELLRLEKLHQALWDRAEQGDLRHVDRVLRIAERRAHLLGLDRPAEAAKPHVEREDGPRVLEIVPLKQNRLEDNPV